MTIIADDTKQKILFYLSEIVNIPDNNWFSLDQEIKLKVIHHLCNGLNSVIPKDNITIPLKHLRPKKIIQICGINKKINNDLFSNYKNTILDHNFDFRKTFINKKHHSYNNMSKDNYHKILNDYNLIIYNFLTENIHNINVKLLYENLLHGNIQKIITNEELNKKLIISNINQNNNTLSIGFNNGIVINCELYLTSEKITNNVPAKYKISLINTI